MYAGEVVFAQLREFLPRHEFERCVRRYGGNRPVRGFPGRAQFLCMAFAQLTYRECLHGNIPSFIHFFPGKMHDVTALGHLLLEPGAFPVMDRGYIDFARW